MINTIIEGLENEYEISDNIKCSNPKSEIYLIEARAELSRTIGKFRKLLHNEKINKEVKG